MRVEFCGRSWCTIFDGRLSLVYMANMIVTADEKRRVALPQPVQPGDEFDIAPSGQAGFVLTRVERSRMSVVLERKNGYLVAVTEHPITQAATRQALDEFP